jgi:hypothetical protein
MRIWYQSFVDPAEQAPYIDRLRDRLRAVAAPGIEIDVHGKLQSRALVEANGNSHHRG